MEHPDERERVGTGESSPAIADPAPFTSKDCDLWVRRALDQLSASLDEAVLFLRGLEGLWTTREDREHFLNAVQLLADEFPRLTGFRGRREVAGWLEPM